MKCTGFIVSFSNPSIMIHKHLSGRKQWSLYHKLNIFICFCYAIYNWGGDYAFFVFPPANLNISKDPQSCGQVVYTCHFILYIFLAAVLWLENHLLFKGGCSFVSVLQKQQIQICVQTSYFFTKEYKAIHRNVSFPMVDKKYQIKNTHTAFITCSSASHGSTKWIKQ